MSTEAQVLSWKSYDVVRDSTTHLVRMGLFCVRFLLQPSV